MNESNSMLLNVFTARSALSKIYSKLYFCNDKAVCFQTLAFTEISGVIYLLELLYIDIYNNSRSFHN